MKTLPMGWIETKLGNLVELAQGVAINVKTNHVLCDKSEGLPLLKINNLLNDTVDLYANPKLVPPKTILKKEDLVFTRTGQVGFVFTNKIGILHNNSFKVIPSEELNKDFLYWFLKQDSVYNYVQKVASGSVQLDLNHDAFKTISISYPIDIKEQKQIANILSSFDKKIELLKEQNQALETMAQTIFKEWFVDFNYPNAIGEMIDSEMGEIPKGWRVFKLEELVNTVNGYSYKGNELVDESTEALVTLKSFNRNGGFQTRGFKPYQGSPKKEQEVVIGDLIVAHTDLTQDAEVLGNPAFVFENGGFHKMYITMDLVKVNSKIQEIQNSFLYYVMKDKRFKGHCVGYSNGTTVLHLSKKAIPEYKIALPENLKLAQDFSNLTENFTKKISHNILEIKNLENIKDSLLPKLMSGQKRVFEYDN